MCWHHLQNKANSERDPLLLWVSAVRIHRCLSSFPTHAHCNLLDTELCISVLLILPPAVHNGWRAHAPCEISTRSKLVCLIVWETVSSNFSGCSPPLLPEVSNILRKIFLLHLRPTLRSNPAPCVVLLHHLFRGISPSSQRNCTSVDATRSWNRKKRRMLETHCFDGRSLQPHLKPPCRPPPASLLSHSEAPPPRHLVVVESRVTISPAPPDRGSVGGGGGYCIAVMGITRQYIPVHLNMWP